MSPRRSVRKRTREAILVTNAMTGNTLGHCFYASDGSSAVEIALKMSFHTWRNQGQPAKNRFLCLAGSYHGETLGTLSVGDVALYKDAYAPLLRQAETVPSPDARQAQPGETAADVARRAAAGLASSRRWPAVMMIPS